MVDILHLEVNESFYFSKIDDKTQSEYFIKGTFPQFKSKRENQSPMASSYHFNTVSSLSLD